MLEGDITISRIDDCMSGGRKQRALGVLSILLLVEAEESMVSVRFASFIDEFNPLKGYVDNSTTLKKFLLPINSNPPLNPYIAWKHVRSIAIAVWAISARVKTS